VLISMVALVISSLFITDSEAISTIWKVQIYSFVTVLALNIIYFFYAQYEGKKYTLCGSCQIGNIVGSIVINLIKLTTIMVVSYFTI